MMTKNEWCLLRDVVVEAVKAATECGAWSVDLFDANLAAMTLRDTVAALPAAAVG